MVVDMRVPRYPTTSQSHRDGREETEMMIRAYDKEEIRRAWTEYTEGTGNEYPWDESIVDDVADIIEQSRYENSKGRMPILTIEEAVEIVADAR